MERYAKITVLSYHIKTDDNCNHSDGLFNVIVDIGKKQGICYHPGSLHDI